MRVQVPDTLSLTPCVEVVEEVTKTKLKNRTLLATVTGSYEGEDLQNVPDVYIYL